MAILLGRTSAGTTGDFNGTQHAAVWPFVAVNSGRAATFFGQTKVANPTGTVTVGIYADSAGAPGARLKGPTTMPGATGTGIFSVDVSSWALDIVSGTTYWIGWRNSAENFDFQGTTGTGYKENSGTVDFPDPFGGSSSGTVDAILWIESADTGSSIVRVRIANNRVGPMALRHNFRPRIPVYGATATTQLFLQNLIANVTSTATLQKQVNKVLSAPGTVVTSIQKQVNKSLVGNSTVSPVIQKQVNKLLSAGATVTGIIQRQINKILVGNTSSTASMQRQTNKNLVGNVSSTGDMKKTVLKNMLATITSSATILALKVIVVNLTATVTASAFIQKLVSKKMTASTTVSASVQKLVTKTLVATSTVTALLDAVKAGISTAISRGVKFIMGRRGYY